MVENYAQISAERIIALLGRAEVPWSITPEKIILYGLFLIIIITAVNWFLSASVIILKPILYAGLMMVVVRPDLIHNVTDNDIYVRSIEAVKNFIGAIVAALLELFHVKPSHRVMKFE